MRRDGRWWRAALVFALLSGPVALLAQTNLASFTGAVTSTDGNPLGGVELVATNVATGVTHTARSNETGRYTIAALPIGTYKIRATSAKFKPFESSPVKLETGQNARVNITMDVAGVEEAVTVTDVAPILQTEDAVVGEVISGETIRTIPLNGRNFAQLSLLLPGVMTTAPDNFTTPNAQGRPYVNGQREQENNFTLDGVDMNEAIDNLLPYHPSPDALAEVRVETNNYSAEFGNVAGALIGSTIKSGTNEWHGTASEYYRDSALAANSWDNNRAGADKGDLKQNIFGASVGGPIVKNKLFFFADYQGFYRTVPGQQVVSVAPLAWRQGDFSAVGVTIVDPLTGNPFPGNRIPEERFSPIAKAVLANQTLYPLPTLPGDSNNLVTGSDQNSHANQGDVKIDANLSDKDRVFARFSMQRFIDQPNRAALESQLLAGNNAPFEGLALNWTRTVSQNSMNELLLGYTHVKFQTSLTDWSDIGDANASIGIPGGQPIAGLSGFDIGNVGFGSHGIQEFNDIKSYQLTERFTLFKGRHTWKFGGRWLHQNQGFSYSGNEGILGHFDYTGAFTGFAFADFLLDDVSKKGRGGDIAPFTHLQNRIAVFAQDDFRVNSNLTLNLGLSWEYTSPLVEQDNRQSNIDLQTGQLLLAGQNGNSRALYDAYYGGFEPRVGFAWTPSDKWVVRGAFGIVQYMEGTGKNLRLPANPPYSFEGQRPYDASTGPGTAQIGFADVSPTAPGAGTLYRIFAPDVRPQLTKQWNIFLERKLTNTLSAQAGYVGSRSTHMVVPFDFNQPEPGVGPVDTWAPLEQRRPLYALNPQVGTTSGTNSIGVGAYDALQMTLRQRESNGLEFLASYTYGKALSDNIGYYGVGWGQTAVQGFYYMDSTDPRRDYGPSPYDIRHNLTVAANYQLPWGRGRSKGSDWSGAKNALLGGWNVNTIVQVRSGLPVTVVDGGGQSLQATRSYERPNTTCSGKTNASGPNDTWIDISCFQRAATGTFGNTGVGTLYGPGFWNVDLGVGKDFYVDSKRYFTLKVEAFNVFNHTNFALAQGTTDISDPVNFGKILNSFSAPRIVELALRFTF